MIKKQYKHSDITEKIIGCAFAVHKKLGYGHREIIYQRCLELEFKKSRLKFSLEHNIPIMYDGVDVGLGRVDFFVEDKVMVELKAQSELDDAHFRQCLNYLETSRLEVGMLINFGSKRLQFRRLINSKLSGGDKP